MNIEVQFLASLMFDPYKINELDKEVSFFDFEKEEYYKIYSGIIDFVIDDKIISYPDLKFKFRDTPPLLSIIEEMQTYDVVDLKTTYTALIAYTQRKKINRLLLNAQNMYEKGTTADDLQAYMDSTLLRIKTHSNIKLESVSDISPTLERNLNNRVKRYKEKGNVIDLPTGLDFLDELTLGLHKKNMWIIGAATSDGKTQLAVQISNNLIKNDASLIYYLLEDDKEQVLYRFISNNTKIPITKIRSGNLSEKEVNKIKINIENLKTGNRLFVDDLSYDVNDIISKTKFAKIKYPKLSVIVVDYIGLVMDRSQKFSTREQEISFISKKLIALSKECDIAILCLAQLNTSPESRQTGMPIKMNDLRDSKAPGHDSAVSIFIHYPFKYKKTKDGSFSKDYAQLLLAKNRYGEVNKIINMTNKADVATFKEGIPVKFKEEM